MDPQAKIKQALFNTLFLIDLYNYGKDGSIRFYFKPLDTYVKIKVNHLDKTVFFDKDLNTIEMVL